MGGRSGSGQSSVANELHYLLAEREVSHALIEGDNLDLAYPAPWRHALAEANLRAMWCESGDQRNVSSLPSAH
jgi:hypothetical protein